MMPRPTPTNVVQRWQQMSMSEPVMSEEYCTIGNEENMGFRMAHLEVLIKVEVPTVLVLFLLWSLHGLFLVRASHDTGFLVVADALFEEVRLAGQGDGFHEVERVGRFVVFLVPEGQKQAIGYEFDILLHQTRIHAQQRTRQCLCQKFLLDCHSLGYDVLHSLLAWSVVQM